MGSVSPINFSVNEVAAGKKLGEESVIQKMMKKSELSKREYAGQQEEWRDATLKNIVVKDHSYYKVRDNLWNETSRLSPRNIKYSNVSNVFK